VTTTTPSEVRRRSLRDRVATVDVRDPTVIAIAILTVFAFFLRFSQIHQSLFGDETFTYSDIYGKSFRAVLSNVHTGGENSPPLFFLLAWATAKLGNATVWIRLFSIILGAATIPVIYLIGRETVGRRAGVVAGAIVALSPFSFYYGVEARPYASMAFFVALSTWALLRAVRHGGIWWWALYAAAAAAAAYCHYTCIFVLIAEGIWSLWVCRDRIRAPLIAAVGAIVLYTPWLPKLRGKELGVIGALEPLTAHNVITDLMRPIGGYPYAPLSAIPTYLGLGLLIACFVVGFGACALKARRDGGLIRLDSWPPHFWLLVTLALTTPVGLFLYSDTTTDLWLARGLYASMPAAALLLGAALVAIPRPVNLVAVVVVLGTLTVGTVRAASPSWRRPPFRSVAAYVDRTSSPQDPVAIVSFIGQPAIAEQLQKPHRSATILDVWKLTPPGGKAFVVLDDRYAHALKLPDIPPAPKGFRLIAHRHFFSAILPSDVSVYRRVG
jgi:hypothetical protein